MLNRLGTYMYWNNSWVNNFNKSIFLNKTLFVEQLLIFIFSEKIFNFFFKNSIQKYELHEETFKHLFLFTKKKFNLKKKKNLKKNIKTRYNFTRFWFIKYNQFILISTFVFSFLKIKKKTKFFRNKIKNFQKKSTIFWRKKKGDNFKKNLFFFKNHLAF